LRRLFSTFPYGWPGVGLLLERMVTAILLVRFGVIDFTGTSFSPSMIPQIISGFAGILFFVGLWTPIVGSLIAAIELWIAMTHIGAPWIPVLLASLGGSVAMIGPGAWSIDARLFGRKRLAI
jgi:putative oxidoreductase